MNPEHGTVIINPQTADRVGRRVALEEIDHPIVLTALRTWEDLRGPQKCPAKAVMTPRMMAPFLRNVILVAAVGERPDYEFRVFGDAAVVAFGSNWTGKRIDALNAIIPGYGDVMERVFNYVRKTCAPLFVRGMLVRAELNANEQQAVFLPLGVDDAVDHVLYVGAYTPTPGIA